MKSHCLIVPMAVATLLATGCQSSPPATGGVLNSSSPTEDATAFPADRTATLWVKGLACPYCVHNIDRQLSGMTTTWQGKERRAIITAKLLSDLELIHVSQESIT